MGSNNLILNSKNSMLRNSKTDTLYMEQAMNSHIQLDFLLHRGQNWFSCDESFGLRRKL